MALIKIKKLFLRAFIGFSSHELGKLQDIVIHLHIRYDSTVAEKSDDPLDSLDYKEIKQRIIHLVENQHFRLLESLARNIIIEIMKFDKVQEVQVEIDKPHALRFAESVSVTLSEKRDV